MSDTKSKYAAQHKHMAENYAQFAFRLRPPELQDFKAKCQRLGTTPTTEIKKFIAEFMERPE
jgi:hypothetical protein